MTTDEQESYDLAVLLEDIERTMRAAQKTRFVSEINEVVRMFDRARMAGVVRYPQP